MIRTMLIVLLSLVSLSAAAPASAQDAAAAPTAAGAPQGAQEPAFTAGAPAGSPATGLPRSGVDRTLRGYWHLFIAFAVTWVLLFGYAISLGRRFGALERKLERQG